MSREAEVNQEKETRVEKSFFMKSFPRETRGKEIKKSELKKMRNIKRSKQKVTNKK